MSFSFYFLIVLIGKTYVKPAGVADRFDELV